MADHNAGGGEPIRVEPRCPGCHSGDFADFDHYCDAAGIHDPAEFPAAFAAWMNALTGWDGPMSEASPPKPPRMPPGDDPRSGDLLPPPVLDHPVIAAYRKFRDRVVSWGHA